MLVQELWVSERMRTIGCLVERSSMMYSRETVRAQADADNASRMLLEGWNWASGVKTNKSYGS